jgi:TolB-like protein
MLGCNKPLLIAVALVTLLGGCATSTTKNTQMAQAELSNVPALGNVEYHTYILANELFAGVRPARQARYAVVGFVPADTMKYNGDDQHPLMMLGHQLEQGMITEASKRGFTTQEFKLSNDIMIDDESDRVLTRNIEQLSDVERVDYYITGTLVYQQAGAMVNARIINVRTKNVVAAATRFFPAELFWEREQVTSRHGKLYRTEGMR